MRDEKKRDLVKPNIISTKIESQQVMQKVNTKSYAAHPVRDHEQGGTDCVILSQQECQPAQATRRGMYKDK